MDRTTLARDLRPLERRGLVRSWKQVQREVRAELGPDRVGRLMAELRAATALSPAPAPRT